MKNHTAVTDFKDLVNRLLHGEFCEREATQETRLGPRCDECAEHVRAAMKSDKTIGAVLATALKERRDKLN